MKTMTDAAAQEQWRKYMDSKASVVVRSAKADEGDGSGSEFVVAPYSEPAFWLGGFGSKDEAFDFCRRNGLPVARTMVA